MAGRLPWGAPTSAGIFATPGAYCRRLLIDLLLSSFSPGLIAPGGRGGVREHPEERTRAGATEGDRSELSIPSTDCCDETRRLKMARRFSSAMVANTDSTLLVYRQAICLSRYIRPDKDFSRCAGCRLQAVLGSKRWPPRTRQRKTPGVCSRHVCHPPVTGHRQYGAFGWRTLECGCGWRSAGLVPCRGKLVGKLAHQSPRSAGPSKR